VFGAACDAAQSAADEKRVTLERRLNPGLALPADPVRLTRALELLVAGAVKRTPAGRSVTVTIARQAERVVWTVEGGAPGHPPAPPRRWVGPFAWLVAQAVALAHGGGLWLELGPGGFAVRLALPVGPERAG
jgi:C4-dicarboxylate-specific signal transduction histidine kinase